MMLGAIKWPLLSAAILGAWAATASAEAPAPVATTPELIAAADLVTEMTMVKHHFAAGVKAQAGIEF